MDIVTYLEELEEERTEGVSIAFAHPDEESSIEGLKAILFFAALLLLPTGIWALVALSG